MKKISLLFISLVTACATSPKGREQVMLLPESEMQTMGTQAFTQLKSQTPLSSDPNQNAFVNCVANAITHTVDKQYGPRQWEVVVFNDPQVNAFALPGGKIGVYSGILKVATTGPELATVLAHEVGHVIARHGNERASQALIAQGGLSALSAVMQQKGPQYNVLMGALGLGVQFGYTLPHTRTQEAEADAIGIDLMAKAGFDPNGAISLWQKMVATQGSKEPPQLLSDHPSSANRVTTLQSLLPEAEKFYAQAPTHPNCSQ